VTKVHLSQALSFLVLSLIPLLLCWPAWIYFGHAPEPDMITVTAVEQSQTAVMTDKPSGLVVIALTTLGVLGIVLLISSVIRAVRGLISLRCAWKWSALFIRVPEGGAAHSPEISRVIASLRSEGMITEVDDDAPSPQSDEVRYAFTLEPRPFLAEHPGKGKVLTRADVTAYLRGRARDIAALQRMRARSLFWSACKLLAIVPMGLPLVFFLHAVEGSPEVASPVVSAASYIVYGFGGIGVAISLLAMTKAALIRWQEKVPPPGVLASVRDFTVAEDAIPSEIDRLLKTGELAIVTTPARPL
jgi:hypothetical protein